MLLFVQSPHTVPCSCTQAYVCEVGYFFGGAIQSPRAAPTPDGIPPPRDDDDDDDDDDVFISSSASGRLQDVFYVLRMMSKVRIWERVSIRRFVCVVSVGCAPVPSDGQRADGVF